MTISEKFFYKINTI